MWILKMKSFIQFEAMSKIRIMIQYGNLITFFID